jgi:hypothetical protein
MVCGMKFLPFLALLALMAGCTSTPEQKEAHRKYVLKERAEWREANFEYYLEDYAHHLGKAVSELNAEQRQEARTLFNRDRPE